MANPDLRTEPFDWLASRNRTVLLGQLAINLPSPDTFRGFQLSSRHKNNSTSRQNMYTTVPNSFEVPPSCGGDELLSNVRPHSPLKKVRSVDFGRVRVRSSLQTSEGASQVASLFSRRAARGSLTRG